jgi:hypothetical protein
LFRKPTGPRVGLIPPRSLRRLAFFAVNTTDSNYNLRKVRRKDSRGGRLAAAPDFTLGDFIEKRERKVRRSTF